MSTVTVESSRFGTLEIEAGAIIEFPAGLIGLGGRRWAVVTNDPESAFQWLHSLDDASLALPVTNPWAFFSDYEVELSDADSERFPSDDVAVWVTVRAGTELADFSANLRAPIIVSQGQGYQVINEAANAPVRASLFPDAASDEAAAA
jgi:flagellar assembly factor FliW